MLLATGADQAVLDRIPRSRMPIYEYTCRRCRVPFEELRSITDTSRPSCPACGGRKVSRLMSRSSFQLKGGGWYKDLYASPRPPKGEAA